MYMRKIAQFILLIILIVAVGCSVQPSQADDYVREIWSRYPELAGKTYTAAIVKRIIDGDTFELDNGDKVRLIGVNTPEITGGKNEPFGLEAKTFATDSLLDRAVLLFSDVSETDRYGRLLRYVFAEPDTQMFNELLIQEGYANTMTIAPDVTYAERFVELERAARSSERGLWGSSELHEAADPACEQPQIKGNINSRNERIYHVPGSTYYDGTVAEVMFCTTEDAEAAGFRAPKR